MTFTFSQKLKFSSATNINSIVWFELINFSNFHKSEQFLTKIKIVYQQYIKRKYG